MKYYYEITGSGPFGWKVYHYDASGNNEVVIARANPTTLYASKEQALDGACEWMEDNNINAELSD